MFFIFLAFLSHKWQLLDIACIFILLFKRNFKGSKVSTILLFETSKFSCWASNLLTHLSCGQGSRQIEHPVIKALTIKENRQRENCLSKADDLKFKFFLSAFFCLLYTIEIYVVVQFFCGLNFF